MNTETIWETAKSIYQATKEFLVPAILFIFYNKMNQWWAESKKKDEEKKRAAADTTETIKGLAQGIQDLAQNLKDRDQHFSEQFVLMNRKIDDNHAEVKGNIKDINQRVDNLIERKN